MRNYLLSVFFLLTTFSLSAQSFLFGPYEERIYPISAVLAEQLLTNEIPVHKLPDLGSPLPKDQLERDLSSGHYLIASLSGERLEYRYKNVHHYQTLIDQEGGRLQFQLFDKNGVEIKDAVVKADGKPVRYNKRKKAYVRRDWRIKHLSIAAGKDTCYFEVSESINRSRFSNDLKHITRNTPTYYVLTPYRLLRNSYRYVKRGIGRGNWRWYNYPFQGKIRNLLHPPKDVNGYVSTSQPRYRPGDTLKVSAYLAKPKGRPLVGDSITMRIRQSSPYRKMMERKIGRKEKGRYVFEMPIPEDWTLDKDYRIDFELPGIMRRQVAPQISFRLEDYELKEYRLKVKAPNNSRLKETAYLDIKTDDINGLALANGEIKVTLLLASFTGNTNSSVLSLPDTLYTHTESTDNRIERRIMLPDSLFPAGYSLRAKARIQLSGPSGEYKEVNRQITIGRLHPTYPKIELRGDSLHLLLEGEAEQGTGMLKMTDENGVMDSLIVDLPHRMRIDHNWRKYILEYKNLKAQEDLGSLRPYARDLINWSGDTLKLNFANEWGQPLRWGLTGDGVAETMHAVKTRSPLSFQNYIPRGGAKPPEPEESFFQAGFKPEDELLLSFSYLAGGIWKHEQREIVAPDPSLLTVHKKVLDLQLEQPEKVQPGETVRLILTASDQAGKPAADVRLSSGTYNARFDKTPTTTPGYTSRRKRERKKQKYDLKKNRFSRNTTPPRWLVEDFQADTLLAYQLRYPDPSFAHLRDLDTILPVGNHLAHFVPFVMKKHKPKRIHLVFADDRLVYYWHDGITTPYSIPIDSGNHEIILRTDKYEYRKTVHFPARQQKIFSFDADSWASAGWRRNKTSVKNGFTKLEERAISKRLFSLIRMNTGKHYFRVGDQGMLQSGAGQRNGGWSPIGLADHYQEVQFWWPDGDSTEFYFESGAAYRISEGRDRLFPIQPDLYYNRYGNQAGQGFPGIPRYEINFTRPKMITRLKLNAPRLPSPKRGESVARLQLLNTPREVKQVVFIAVNGTSFREELENVAKNGLCCYFEVSKGVNRTPAGTYDLYYYFGSDSVRHRRIELPIDSLTVLPYQTVATRLVDSIPEMRRLHHPQQKSPGKTIDFKPNPAEPAENISYFRSNDGEYIAGILTDNQGEPLIGASIFTEGKRQGTVTDIDGAFTVQLPPGSSTLIFSYLGYVSKRIQVDISSGQRAQMDVFLEESSANLSEVVVTGYRITQGRTVTSQEIRNLPTRDINALRGRAAGVSISNQNAISIRGSRSNATDYYVDGIRVQGKLIPESEIQEISVTEKGVFITSKVGNSAADLPPPTIRSDFRDYAAFLPHLQTDKEGKAAFDVTFPDDITAWNTYVVGQDRRRRIGFTLEQTNAFLPFQAQLYLPRFLVEGDRSEAATLAINREEEEKKVRLIFSGDEVAEIRQDTLLKSVIDQRFPIQSVGGMDSMHYQFSLQDLDFKVASNNQAASSDGEQRSIPIYPKGTEMVSGQLMLLTDQETRLPDSLLSNERGPVHLQLLGNRLDQLLKDLDHLVDYPYACTEQTASRLIGLVSLKKIREAQGEDFEKTGQILKMIGRLTKLQRKDGSFGWWPGSARGSHWISLHVFRALALAESAGFTIPSMDRNRQFLFTVMADLPRRDRLQIALALALAENGNPPTKEEMNNYDTNKRPNDYELLTVARLRQLRGDTIDVERLLDSSTQHSAIARYWGERRFLFYRQPLNDRLACGLLAQKLLAASGYSDQADETVNYLMGQTAAPRAGSRPLMGTNTLESARLVAELLPYLLTDDEVLALPEVTLSTGKRQETITEFPYETVIPVREIKNATLTRAGSGTLPMSLYQRWFESEPQVTNNGFQLTSEFVDAKGRRIKQLEKGITAYLEVTIQAKKDANYVLIEVPIPGGCSYQNRREYRGRYAVHREYRRDRVAIFCDNLPAGKHVYRVALAPRFSGTYTLNPARAEMQYLPVVNGNGALEEIEVE